jgi:hypothetical protein
MGNNDQRHDFYVIAVILSLSPIMSNLAEAKNLILFQKMAKNMIDGDLEIFREVTGLLTTWLSKRQAYYPSALFQV